MNAFKNSLVITVAALVNIAVSPTTMQAESANVELRFEGHGLTVPDTINGLRGIIMGNTKLTLTWSMELDFLTRGASLGFRVYSPDNSLSSIVWRKLPGPVGPWLDPSVWNFSGGTRLVIQSLDGQLGDLFMFGGVASTFAENGFGPAGVTDIMTAEISTAHENGSICVDSVFFPPAAEWIILDETGNFGFTPTWGASEGGYPDGGLCFTTVAGCCQLQGDANFDGRVNISDITSLISRIFVGKPAPPCQDQADVNGDGAVNIADPVDLISYIFANGAEPRCGATGT